MSPAPPTDYEAPPTAKMADVRHTSSGRSNGLPDDNRSAVDSDTEYGSADETIDPVVDSAEVVSPVSRSLDTDRELHLGQLMESIL